MKKQLIRVLALTSALLCLACSALASDVPTCPLISWDEYVASSGGWTAADAYDASSCGASAAFPADGAVCIRTLEEDLARILRLSEESGVKKIKKERLP